MTAQETPDGPLPDPVLEFAAVRKSYREGPSERTVLDGIDLRVARGELVGLLGRSGSGKSTVLHLAGGVDHPTGGRVCVDGRELADLSEAERTRLRRRTVGFVFQGFHLVPTLTIAENIGLPLELDRRLDESGRERVASLLARVGLADRSTALPDQLSGGEQQRVAIARALVHEPLLVLADEPTGNLDEDTAEVIMDLLQRLVREEGTAILVATHSAEFAARCDRVERLDHGRLQSLASPDARANELAR